MLFHGNNGHANGTQCYVIVHCLLVNAYAHSDDDVTISWNMQVISRLLGRYMVMVEGRVWVSLLL
jgi:hypothetical protein